MPSALINGRDKERRFDAPLCFDLCQWVVLAGLLKETLRVMGRALVESKMNDHCFSHRLMNHTEMMDRMMMRLGVDKTVALGVDGGLAFLEAKTKCVFCAKPERCSQWLADAEPLAGPEEFCPNTGFFAECQPQDASVIASDDN